MLSVGLKGLFRFLQPTFVALWRVVMQMTMHHAALGTDVAANGRI